MERSFGDRFDITMYVFGGWCEEADEEGFRVLDLAPEGAEKLV